MKPTLTIILFILLNGCQNKKDEGIFNKVPFVHDTIYTPAKHDTLIIVENTKPKPNKPNKKKFKRSMWGPDTIFTHYPLYIDTTVEGKRIIKITK